MQIGQSLASGTDAKEVAARAARESLAQAGGGEPELVLVFSTEGYDATAVMEGVTSVVGAVTIAGCQAPGVLACNQVTHDGVGIMVVTEGGLQSWAAIGENATRDSRGAGAAAALSLLEQCQDDVPFERSAFMLLPDAIAGNSCEIVRGVSAELGGVVRVIGGGSGDNLKFQQTFQYGNGAAYTGAVLGLGLASASPIGIALRHGCLAWGPPMRVTHAEGKLLHELEWTPAFDQYVQVVQQLSGEQIARDTFMEYALLHPFGIPQDDRNYVLRSPFQPGPNGEIYCCSDLPPDGVLRIMVGDRHSLLEAAREAGAEARKGLLGYTPAAALVFACVSRDLVLGGHADLHSDELAAVREGLQADVPLFGCLTFGQIGTIGPGLPQFHSKSIQVCAFSSVSTV
jgi:hypothetical protein